MNFNYILNKVPNLSECKTLDIFAREGDWQSYELVSKVKSIEAYVSTKSIHDYNSGLSSAFEGIDMDDPLAVNDIAYDVTNIKEYSEI